MTILQVLLYFDKRTTVVSELQKMKKKKRK